MWINNPDAMKNKAEKYWKLCWFLQVIEHHWIENKELKKKFEVSRENTL